MITNTYFKVRTILPGEFDPKNHWYEKALNAQIHPLVAYFFRLTKPQIGSILK